MDDLDKVLKTLKDGKCKDPAGLVNELFTYKNIGNNLKESILALLNKSKEELQSPDFMENAEVHIFYKNKGEKTDLESYRGIFILSIIRTIKDKLIHNDIKDIVFETMSDSQVGATKGRSIRNHIFIVNSVVNEVKEKRDHSIDLLIYDVRKCFDELDLSECVNDLYETGIKDDKLNLIYESNKNNNMAVNVPSVGLSERAQIKNKITKGGTLGPSICAVHRQNRETNDKKG